MKPRSSKRTWDILTSADDTTLVLNRNYKPDLMITGTGVLQVYDLGDATTYPLNNGRTSAYRNIYNGTPEFIGVINSDGTVFHRVPPRAVCECVLMDNSTAAGVWWSAVMTENDPRWESVHHTDFIEQNQTSGTRYTAVGTFSTVNLYTSQASGYFYTSVAAAASVSLGYSPHRGFTFGDACRSYEVRTSLGNLSTGVEEFISRIGPGDNIVGGTHTNGCYFLYDRATYGDFWVVRNINGAGNNTVVTTAVPSVYTTYQLLRVEVDSAAVRSDYWVDDVQVSPVGGLNTFVPLVATRLYHVIGLTKTVGNTARLSYYDYANAAQYFTSKR